MYCELKVLCVHNHDKELGEQILALARKIRFTKHATEKFDVLKHYGFEIRKKSVINTILDPEHLEERGIQFFVTRIIDSKHALRVVYEDRKDYLVVITF